MTDLGHLRIGTADRRDAVARIDRAAAEGRLMPGEASDRLARVEAALTYADLDPLISDLPSITPPVVPAGWSAANRLPISGGMSREKREGRWEIPPYLRVVVTSAPSGSTAGRRSASRRSSTSRSVPAPAASRSSCRTGGASTPTWSPRAGGRCATRGAAGRAGSAPTRPPRVGRHGQRAGTAGDAAAPSGAAASGARRVRPELTSGPAPASRWVQEHSEMPNADDLR